MNILFLCEADLHCGGVAEVVKHLCNMLDQKGHNCFIYNSGEVGETTYPFSGIVQGDLIHRKKYLDIKSCTFNYKVIKNLHYYIDKWNIDVVHCHEVGAPFLSAIMSTDIPVIVSSHGHVFNKRYDKKRIVKPYLKYMSKVKSFIALNYVMKQRIEEVFGGVPISIIPNGIEDGWITQETFNHKNIILAAGRFSREKRMDICINAYCKSKAKTKMPLVIIGSGSEQQGLELLAKEQNLCIERVLPFDGNFDANTVYLPGYIDGSEKEKLFERASVFLHPSEFEAFGIVLIEALAKGSIVIAKDLDTYRSQFLGMPFAIKYLADNEAIVWANALDQAVEEAGDASCVQQSIDACSVFLWNKLFEKYINIYQSSLKRAVYD